MGVVGSVKRNRRTQPAADFGEVDQSTKVPSSTTAIESYRQKKLTRLTNPFQVSAQRHVLPNSLQYFTKQSETNKKNVDYYADNNINNFTFQPDELCFICNVYSTTTDIFTCRVCMKAFHEGCLQKIGNLSSEVSTLHASAISKSNFGWSCYKCSNLSVLLMEDEMHEIMDLFDDYDTNQDTQISKEEYSKFKEKQYTTKIKEPFTKEQKELAEEEFDIIDRDQTGTIDWWEFLNHESVKMLIKREKQDLVAVLSKKEVADAKEKFKALDVDNDGKITAYEAAKVYSEWFSKLSGPKKSDKVSGKNNNRSSQDLNAASHAYNHTMLVMEADIDNNKYVDWKEYLENEALYIIATRPNIPMPSLLTSAKRVSKAKS